jgi:hypothetical protein
MLPRLLLLTLLLLAQPAVSQAVWQRKSGQPVPDTLARTSKDGLGVWAVVTESPDWEKQWRIQERNLDLPDLVEPVVISSKGRYVVLTFVVNPRTNSQNEVNVDSHVQILRADNSIALDVPRLKCLRGLVNNEATRVHLCESRVQFSPAPDDRPGIWKVKVTVRDHNRGLEILVRSGFALEAR